MLQCMQCPVILYERGRDSTLCFIERINETWRCNLGAEYNFFYQGKSDGGRLFLISSHITVISIIICITYYPDHSNTE